MEPTVDEIAARGLDKSLKAIVEWTGMKGELAKAWAALMGFEDAELESAHPRLLAALSEQEYEALLVVDTEEDKFTYKLVAEVS